MKHIKKIILVILIVILIITCTILIKSSNQTNTKSADVKNFTNSEITSYENLWCSNFQIAWKELAKQLEVPSIVFTEDQENYLANKLNNTSFGLNSISDKDYYIYADKASSNSKSIIKKELKQKFEKKSDFLDSMDFSNVNGHIVYSYLEKNYTFLNKFDQSNEFTFIDKNNNEHNVKGFEFTEKSNSKLLDNVKSSYYIHYTQYGICLNTKENEEIILIMTPNIDADFQTIWEEHQENKETYKHYFSTKDELFVPYININCFINYEELCGKYIDGTAEWISSAVQNISFSLDESGGKMKQENLVTSEAMSIKDVFVFNRPFVVFVKEADKEEPYFAFKVYDETFLVLDE